MPFATHGRNRRQTTSTSRTFSPTVRGLAAASTLAIFALAGCASSAHMLTSAEAASSLSGYVHSAGQPVGKAQLQLYAAGDGMSINAPLLKQPLVTSASGAFNLITPLTCPSASSQLYLVATGGAVSAHPTSSNSASTLVAAVGACDTLTASPALDVNELTTAAAVAALAPFMPSVASVGAKAGDQQPLRDAFTAASDLADSLTEATADPSLPQAQLDSVQKLATLANILSACTGTTGGEAGDGTPCGTLFSYAHSAEATAPRDTASALLAILNNPARNVAPIFSLRPVSAAFHPALASAPQDWTIALGNAPPQPTFSPAPGTYSLPQTITLSDADSAAQIFYSIDGAWHPYTAPFVLLVSKSVKTMALSSAISRAASATYTVIPPKLVFLTQPASTSAGAVLSPPPSVAIEDAAGAIITSANYPVTLALSANSTGGVLNGAITVTAINGVATFPSLSIPAPGTAYTFKASANGATPAVSNAFNNSGSITLFPGTTTLTAGQSTTGFFTLSQAAPAGGTVVTLTSSDPTITSISPLSQTIPQGQSSGNFTYKNITSGTVTLSGLASGFTPGALKVTTAGIAVSLSSHSASLSASQSLQLTAAVTGSSNTAVRWTVSPAVGSISSNGLYTAPASTPIAQTITATATSVADTTKTATASIALTPQVSVAVSPLKASVGSSQSQQFSATITGSSSGVYWSISPSIGNISSSGLYTAPASVPAGQIITVTAISNADSSKKAEASLTFGSSVAVSLTPGNATVVAGRTQQFSSTVNGTTNTALTWSISPALGSITSYGLYTAPTSFITGQVVNVVATSVADPSKSAYVPVNLAPAVAITISPISLSMVASQSQQFSAAVTGTSNAGVAWSMSPAIGSLSSTGLYSAPASVASGQTVIITATSIADANRKASASINLTNPVAVTLTPGTAKVPAGGTQQFSSAVTGTTNTALIWSISPALGSISSYGLYTAPTSFNAGQVVNVVATSVADPTRSAYVPVTLTSSAPPPTGVSSSGIGVTMTPASVSLYASQIQQYSVYVTGTRTIGITFSVSPAVGSVSQVGLYTAPASVTTAQTVSVIATSNADGISRAVSTVSLIPPVTFAATATVPASFFGMTVLNFLNNTPQIPIGTTRSWDSYPDLSWAASNPMPGVYNFTAVDSFVTANQKRGSEMIYTLGRTPQWASYLPNQAGNYGPGQCAAPANFANYDAYVTALATHVAGKIKYWELWNEVNDPKYYCGDIGSQVVMAQHAYRIIKAIDPAAIILSPSVTGGPGPAWLASFLALGGGNSVDIIAFHGYASATPEDLVGVISAYRAVMAAAGISSKAIWDTESSWAGTGNIGTPTSAAQVAFVANAKDYLLHWSQGISRFVWYAYDGGTVWGGFLTSANTPSAAVTSYAQTYRWMVGASLSAPCSENLLTQIWTCGLSRSNGYQAQAIWLTGATRTVAVPSQYIEYRDLAGNVVPITNHTVTIGDQPLLLESAPLP